MKNKRTYCRICVTRMIGQGWSLSDIRGRSRRGHRVGSGVGGCGNYHMSPLWGDGLSGSLCFFLLTLLDHFSCAAWFLWIRSWESASSWGSYWRPKCSWRYRPTACYIAWVSATVRTTDSGACLGQGVVHICSWSCQRTLLTSILGWSSDTIWWRLWTGIIEKYSFTTTDAPVLLQVERLQASVIVKLGSE